MPKNYTNPTKVIYRSKTPAGLMQMCVDPEIHQRRRTEVQQYLIIPKDDTATAQQNQGGYSVSL